MAPAEAPVRIDPDLFSAQTPEARAYLDPEVHRRVVAVLLGDADEAPVLAGEGLEGREETPAD